jgi:hypothetical protein
MTKKRSKKFLYAQDDRTEEQYKSDVEEWVEKQNIALEAFPNRTVKIGDDTFRDEVPRDDGDAWIEFGDKWVKAEVKSLKQIPKDGTINYKKHQIDRLIMEGGVVLTTLFHWNEDKVPILYNLVGASKIKSAGKVGIKWGKPVYNVHKDDLLWDIF